MVATSGLILRTRQVPIVRGQIEKQEAENHRLQQELQDARDQNELLEFRNLELEVRNC